MKTALFPHRFRLIGWIVLGLGILLAFASMHFEFEPLWMRMKIPALLNDRALDQFLDSSANDEGSYWRTENMTNELMALLILFGCLFVAFSKERVEDEYLSHLRLSAMVWAVYVNSALVVCGILFLYAFHFLYFMMFNLFAMLLLFIARYHYLLSKMRKADDQ